MTTNNNKTSGRKKETTIRINDINHKLQSKTKTKPKQQTTNKTTKHKTKTTKTKTKTNKTKRQSPTKYANHPDYEFDTIKKRWVKKSDLRPIELVNKYKLFLIEYLKKSTTMNPKEIEKIVKTHATSSKRLSEILVKKGAMTKKEAEDFFYDYNFWNMELCKYMKKICPTETDIEGTDWCEYGEDLFCFHKDNKTGFVSCYSLDDILGLLSSSFTDGDDYRLSLQLPRDPYTRKVLTEDLIKTLLKQIRYYKDYFRNYADPHVVYFLRNYKKFYANPNIKPFLQKTTLTSQEKYKLSEAIENFMTKTNEIRHGWGEGHIRWWFWIDGKEPKDKYKYIFHS